MRIGVRETVEVAMQYISTQHWIQVIECIKAAKLCHLKIIQINIIPCENYEKVMEENCSHLALISEIIFFSSKGFQ